MVHKQFLEEAVRFIRTLLEEERINEYTVRKEVSFELAEHILNGEPIIED